LATKNGYSFFVFSNLTLTIKPTADGGGFNYSGLTRDDSEISFNGDNFKLTETEGEKYLYIKQVSDYLFTFLPKEIQDKINADSTTGDVSNEGIKAQKTMEYAVLLSPYSKCQHGVTEMQRAEFIDNINTIESEDKIDLYSFLEGLSQNHIANEKEGGRRLSFEANGEIYYEHNVEPDKSGRVLAEEKFSEFKEKAENKLAEGMIEGGSSSANPLTDYVEFHEIENYFDAEDLQGAGGSAATSDGSPDKSKTAIVFFHANEKENSQTVISGEAVFRIGELAKQDFKFIEYSVLRHFSKHANDANGDKNALLKSLTDNYKLIIDDSLIPDAQTISTEKFVKYLHDDGLKNYNQTECDGYKASIPNYDTAPPPPLRYLCHSLTNLKIANDFLECKIEAQQQPKNIPPANQDALDASRNKLNEASFAEDQAKLALESAFGKKPFCELEPQYHSMKNIFQAGISIRRHKDHPHLVDIVRVIGEDAAQSPNLQFVAIKGQGDDDGKTTLTIKRPGEIQETIAGKVFFRKVELGDDGNVSFDNKIYYYDGNERKSFDIGNNIVQDGNKDAFLGNLGKLKIRATCVMLGEDNQPKIENSKFSSLDKDNSFKNFNIRKEDGVYELGARTPLSPPPSTSPMGRAGSRTRDRGRALAEGVVFIDGAPQARRGGGRSPSV
jgi:hypothetical protein